jgi:hypothetical protein
MRSFFCLVLIIAVSGDKQAAKAAVSAYLQREMRTEPSAGQESSRNLFLRG